MRVAQLGNAISWLGLPLLRFVFDLKNIMTLGRE